jgi:hypothetical protein
LSAALALSMPGYRAGEESPFLTCLIKYSLLK